VNDAAAADLRSAALEAYIATRSTQGFRIETRSATQAVLVRRHRLHFVARWVARGMADERLVVSVDEHGGVVARRAEPVRW
jgi:hypothetical protein